MARNTSLFLLGNPLNVVRLLLAGMLALALLAAGCSAPPAATTAPHRSNLGNGAPGGQTVPPSPEATGTGGSGESGESGGSGGTGENGSGTSSDPSNGSAADAPATVYGPPRNWTPVEQATIRPGASLDDGSCTANFVFTSLDNATVYIGTAAHCFSEGDNTQTNGCEVGSKPLGTEMNVQGASQPATLVYSSWLTMKKDKEADPTICAANDWAVLKLNAADAKMVNPAMWVYGGPTGIADPATIQSQEKVLTYGSSNLRLGVEPYKHKEGYVLEVVNEGWSVVIYTSPPGVPGDSGSAVVLATGPAIGDFVTLDSFPPAGNSVTSLSMAMAYAKAHGFQVQLATAPVLDAGLLP